MRTPVIAVSAIAVLAALGFGGIYVYEKQVAAGIEAVLKKNNMTIGSARYSLFKNTAEITGLEYKFTNPARTVTVEKVLLTKPNLKLDDAFKGARSTQPVALFEKLEGWGVKTVLSDKAVVAYEYGYTETAAVIPGKLPVDKSLETALIAAFAGEPRELMPVFSAFVFGGSGIRKLTGQGEGADIVLTEAVMGNISDGIVSSLDVTGLSGKVPGQDGGSFSIGRLKISQMDLVKSQTGLALGGFQLEKLAVDGTDGVKVGLGGAELIKPLPLDFAEVEASQGKALGKWGFDKIGVSGVTVEVPKDGVKFSFGNFSVDGFASHKIRSIRFGGLKGEVKEAKATFGLDAFEADDIDMTRLITLGEPRGNQARRGRLAGFIVDAPDHAQVSLKELTSETTKFEDGLPVAGVSRISEFALDNAQDSGLKMVLDGLGYKRLSFDMDIDYTLKLTDGLFDLKTFSIIGKDMGKLVLSGQIAGMDKETILSGNPFQMLESLMLDKLTLRYDDQSLINRAYSFAAAQQGGRPEMMKMMAQTVLDQQIADYEDYPAVVEALKAVKLFANDPRNLTLTLTPDEPLGYEDFLDEEDPAAMAELLGLKVVANQ